MYSFDSWKTERLNGFCYVGMPLRFLSTILKISDGL